MREFDGVFWVLVVGFLSGGERCRCGSRPAT